jgi:hypothetical protein
MFGYKSIIMEVKVVVPPPEQKAIIDKLANKVAAQGEKAE